MATRFATAAVICSALPRTSRSDEPPLTTEIRRGVGVDRAGVDRGLDDLVDLDRQRRVDRGVGLQPRELDDLLDEPGQPLGLGDHPAAEALHRLRVVGRVVHGLGEQPDRADRCLELVAHVGDEVAADRLDLPLPRPVLDQREHQPGAERGDAGGDVARRQAVGPAHQQLGLADRPVAAYLLDEPGQLGRHEGVPLHQPEGVRRCAGLDHDVVLAEHDRTAAEHREHGGDARWEDGLLGRRRACAGAGR